MKRLIVVMGFLSMSLYGLSNAEATKFVDQYDGMSKRILGLINCVSRALTGDDAISSVNDSSVGGANKGPSNMRSCVEAAGFKTGSGFGKLLTAFSKEGESSQAEASKAEAFEPTEAPNLIQRKVATDLAIPPQREKKTALPVTPKTNTTVKTKW